MVDEKCFQIVELPGRGRALLTIRTVRAGEIVLKDSPTVLCVDASGALKFCGTCLRICGDAVPACSGCSSTKFCSPGCSAAHSKEICSALGHMKEEEFDSETENQARFLVAAYHVALVTPKEFEKVLSLEGVGKADDEDALKLHSFVEEAVKTWHWNSGHEPSAELTADLLVKDSHNGIGLMVPCKVVGQRAVRGYGLYPTASFINHECLPNCCRFDYVDTPGNSNTEISIRAMHDIEKETEITISYFPINWPYEVRQERLQMYGFKCECERCLVEMNWSDAEGEEHDAYEEEDQEGEEEETKGKEEQNNVAEEPALEETVETLRLKTSKMDTKPEEEEEVEVAEGDEEGEEEEEDEDDDDFEHAMFFVKYLCPMENCGGTMAPIPPNSDTTEEHKSDSDDAELFLTMECNMCGHMRTGEEFRKDLEDHSILE